MIISLIGYMGCGKSSIGKSLSAALGYPFLDLDVVIEAQEGLSIPLIFEKKGEIYFRKKEHEVLQQLLLTSSNIILSLGGGTPCYYDNMSIINQYSESIYLNVSLKELVKRLAKGKSQRPLLASLSDDALTEFIAKHLFERKNFYIQAKHILSVENESIEDTVSRLRACLSI